MKLLKNILSLSLVFLCATSAQTHATISAKVQINDTHLPASFGTVDYGNTFFTCLNSITKTLMSKGSAKALPSACHVGVLRVAIKRPTNSAIYDTSNQGHINLISGMNTFTLTSNATGLLINGKAAKTINFTCNSGFVLSGSSCIKIAAKQPVAAKQPASVIPAVANAAPVKAQATAPITQAQTPEQTCLSQGALWNGTACIPMDNNVQLLFKDTKAGPITYITQSGYIISYAGQTLDITKCGSAQEISVGTGYIACACPSTSPNCMAAATPAIATPVTNQPVAALQTAPTTQMQTPEQTCLSRNALWNGTECIPMEYNLQNLFKQTKAGPITYITQSGYIISYAGQTLDITKCGSAQEISALKGYIACACPSTSPNWNANSGTCTTAACPKDQSWNELLSTCTPCAYPNTIWNGTTCIATNGSVQKLLQTMMGMAISGMGGVSIGYLLLQSGYILSYFGQTLDITQCTNTQTISIDSSGKFGCW